MVQVERWTPGTRVDAVALAFSCYYGKCSNIEYSIQCWSSSVSVSGFQTLICTVWNYVMLQSNFIYPILFAPLPLSNFKFGQQAEQNLLECVHQSNLSSRYSDAFHWLCHWYRYWPRVPFTFTVLQGEMGWIRFKRTDVVIIYSCPWILQLDR